MSTETQPLPDSYQTNPADAQRIFAQRLLIILVAFLVPLTATFAFVGYEASKVHHAHWLDFVPWKELSGGAFSVLLIAFAYEWLVRKEEERRSTARLTRLLRNESALVAQRVLDQLLGSSEFAASLSDEKLDATIKSALGARIRDAGLAEDWYAASVDAVLHDTRRRSDYRCEVILDSVPTLFDPETGATIFAHRLSEVIAPGS